MTYCICDSFVQDFSHQSLIRYFGIDVNVFIDSSIEVICEGKTKLDVTAVGRKDDLSVHVIDGD
jgi:hypothetical protein